MSEKEDRSSWVNKQMIMLETVVITLETHWTLFTSMNGLIIGKDDWRKLLNCMYGNGSVSC